MTPDKGTIAEARQMEADQAARDAAMEDLAGDDPAARNAARQALARLQVRHQRQTGEYDREAG